MMNKCSRLFLMMVSAMLLSLLSANSQSLVEAVVAVVGNEVIYLSDVENMIIEYKRNGSKAPTEELRCRVLEEQLIAKLFLDQARIDSVIVTDDMVESELNVNLNNAIRTAGSEKVLEDAFRKSMVEIRQDIRKRLVENETIREVQSKIAESVTVTPSALKRFFANIPKDSLPVVPAKVQISIIQLDPPEMEENKAEARQRLLDIRGEILAGKKSFSLEAIMYSEDPGTASKGGEMGYATRGELEKEYADEAFSLTKGSVSKIVETRYGFHIIQLIDRKGDLINTRHILIRPKVKADESVRAMNKLDSIANLIRKDSMDFESAARRYSTHKDSRINGGKLVSTNPSDRVTWFTLEELNQEMYVQVRDLKVGEISDPFRTTDENNNVVFRIVKLDNEIPAHRANLNDDYQALANVALMEERTKTYDKWIKKKLESTYIKIIDEFKSCPFLQTGGWLK